MARPTRQGPTLFQPTAMGDSRSRRLEQLDRWSREARYGKYPMSGQTRQRALTAAVSSVDLGVASWREFKFNSSAWQDELWRQYDINGSLRFVAGWAAGCVSRAIMEVWETDPDGNATTRVDDERVAQLGSGPLGTGDERAEALRLLGLDLYVAGEAFLIVEAESSRTGEDRWWVVTANKINKLGDTITTTRPSVYGGGTFTYRPGHDMIIRCWTPHPRDTEQPDASTRSVIPELRELELTRKRVFAELDSRLTGAGILAIPDTITLPRGPDDPNGIDGFVTYLARAMQTSLTDRSSAAAMVPIMLTGDPESLKEIRHIELWSEFSDKLVELRQDATTSLAQGLDVPPEILKGLGGSNHWCVPAEAEILTRRGWITHNMIGPRDVALTVDPETYRTEWQPIIRVNRWDVDDYPMTRIEHEGHRSLSTGTHRWLTTRGFATTAELTDEYTKTGHIITSAERGRQPARTHTDDRVTELADQCATDPDTRPETVQTLSIILTELTDQQLIIITRRLRQEPALTYLAAELLSVAETILGSGRRVIDPDDATTSTERHTGVIWCPTTPNGTWIMRYQGHVTVTGNSAWAISEGAVRQQIDPLLSRISAPLTVHYLRPAAEALGASPEYAATLTYRFDTSPLLVRPDRSADAIQLWDRKIVSTETARSAGAWPEGAAPSKEETAYRLAVDLFERSPELALSDPGIREMLGITGAAAPNQNPTDPATQPVADPKPAEPANGPPDAGGDRNPDEPSQTAAAGSTDAALLCIVARRAMTLAGQRLIPHRERGRYSGTPPYCLSAHAGPVSETKAAQILEGAWRDVDIVARVIGATPDSIIDVMSGMCEALLTRGVAYSDDMITPEVLTTIHTRGTAS